MHAVVDSVLERLRDELATASSASEQAHAAAIHSENIADNKYDTLAVEAAYLAHGQSMRIADLQLSIAQYGQLTKLSMNTSADAPVQLGNVVTVTDEDGRSQLLFIGPSAGGMRLPVEGEDLLVVTPQTPMGGALIGKLIDDEVCLTVGSKKQYFVITNIQQ